jgi:hypothetical protein
LFVGFVLYLAFPFLFFYEEARSDVSIAFICKLGEWRNEIVAKSFCGDVQQYFFCGDVQQYFFSADTDFAVSMSTATQMFPFLTSLQGTTAEGSPTSKGGGGAKYSTKYGFLKLKPVVTRRVHSAKLSLR